ncbi:MAG: DUF4382 domain-containing protein [Gammaproteobacteria bacterium]|nr:DUF4382 domain-containing protein [Gammaproteobacteria bacterium]
MRIHKKLWWKCIGISVLAVLAAVSITSCGGGSGDGSASSDGVGSVAVLLTDGPTSSYDQVNLTLTQIELIGDNGASAAVFSGERTVNLLDLSDDAEVFSLVDAPAGIYHKIRFTLTALELVRLDESGAIVEVVEPELPANGKVDLNPRMDFIVSGEEPLVLQLDLDADKSLQAIRLGNGRYRFRPVVFVEIVSGATLGRYARLEGTATEVDTDAGTFSLCGSRTTFRHHRNGRWGQWGRGDRANGAAANGVQDRSRCIPVTTGTDVSVFTGAGAASIADLADDVEVAVFGRLVRSSGDTAFTMQAQVIAIGPDEDFAYIKGTATSDYDAGSNAFTLDVIRGGAFDTGATITATALEGARVFTRSGTELSLDDVTAGFGVKVFGVPTGATPELQAAVVFVNDVASAETELSGTLASLDVANATFTLLGTAQGDVCVRVRDRADIFLIGSDSGSQTSDAVSLEELSDGLVADVYGRFELTGCLAASDIIVTAAAPAVEE